MQVVSTNIGKPTLVLKNGKEVKTGFFKQPVNTTIKLLKKGVEGDAVMDTKHHGGIDKACYLYSADHYSYWQQQFPDLEWGNGMFGENLTVKGLDESKLFIGDVFEVGTATIQISEPRRPCAVLGVKFGTQQMVKEFYHTPYPGAYVRVLKEGEVKSGDTFSLVKSSSKISIKDVFSLFAINTTNTDLAKKTVEIEQLSENCKNSIIERFNL